MIERLDGQKLKSGESLEIGVVTAPDERFAADIESLLVHKGPHWQTHIHSALREETDRLETRFYLGLIEEHPVANIMTVEQQGVGILGHVFTRPEQRRKGIASAVMQRQMDHFRQRGGHVLLLGTGFEIPPYWIYHSFGFRSLRDGFMRYAVEQSSAFEQRWFAPAPAQIVPAEWRHWPLVALLASLPGNESLRSVAWKIADIENLEGPYVHFMHLRRNGEPAEGLMLETESGAVVGCATLVPVAASGHELSGDWLLDVFTHPQFDDRIGDLIDALTPRPGRTIAYVAEDACEKARALEAHGFTRGDIVLLGPDRKARFYARESG